MDELELDTLIAQLTDEFPRLAAAEVNTTVREVHASTGGTIEAYVPLMVARRGRARLAARSAPVSGARAVSGVPPLGATVSADGVTFCIFSRDATHVTLALFDDAEDAVPARTIELEPRTNCTYHYWHVFVPGLLSGQLYGFHVDGPRRPADGLMFDPDKLLVAPYALSVAFPRDYSREDAIEPGDNTATAPKGVVVDPSAYDWEGDRPLGRDFDATFIYEMHDKGFTASETCDVSADARGTYRGLVEKIPYLKELGVTTVELLPVQQFDCLTAPEGRINYWGYQPMAMFAPHAQYSSRTDPLGPVEEFRDLVKALHAAGIEVILDVVFNHTSEGGVGGTTTSWRGFDNLTYYIVNADGGLSYDDFTGTGNTFNTNETVVRRFILDCLRSWVQHMHVDGFRFDLAPVLSRGQDGVPLRNPPILWDIETDPVLADTKIIAEAWDAVGLYEVATFVGDRLPPLDEGYRWCRLVDTAMASPDDFCDPPHPLKAQDRYRVEGRSSIVLVALPNYEWRGAGRHRPADPRTPRGASCRGALHGGRDVRRADRPHPRLRPGAARTRGVRGAAAPPLKPATLIWIKARTLLSPLRTTRDIRHRRSSHEHHRQPRRARPARGRAHPPSPRPPRCRAGSSVGPAGQPPVRRCSRGTVAFPDRLAPAPRSR